MMFEDTRVKQKIVIKQISFYHEPGSEYFLEFGNGGELYDFFVKLDKNERFMEEVLDFKKTICRPFIVIRYARYAKVSDTSIRDLFSFFKQHLVDCGFVQDINQVLSLWAVDMSTNAEIIMRCVFDCGEYYFENLLLLQQCLSLFKQRIITDKKNSVLVPLFTFKDNSLADHQTKMIFDTQLVDEMLLKSSESLFFRVRLFGHPNDRGLGFMSGIPNSRFVYMKDSDLQLEDIDSNNAKCFALSKEEFCHLLLSDTTSYSNAKKRSLKIVSSLNEQKIVKTSLSNAVTPLYKYYDNVYPFDLIWKIFGDPFREINYVSANSGWKRGLHFKSVEQFKQSVLDLLPVAIHFGAIYDRNPKEESKVIVSKELVFDVDLNDYCLKKKDIAMPGEFDLRKCCGSEPKACSKCWKLAIFAAKFVSLVLTKMLAFKPEDIRYVFSGRRGMHCIVSDKRACSMGAKERTDILNFFSKDGAKHFHFPIINELYKRFAAPLLEVFLNEQDANLKKAFFDYVEQRKRKKMAFALEISTLQLFWPRFDIAVTTQLGHPFKSPFVKHPETQNICEFFDPFSDYDPFQKKK